MPASLIKNSIDSEPPRDPLAVLSTRINHILQGPFLSTRDAKAILCLDSNPASGIGAVEARERWLPGVWRRIALLLVDIVCDCPQLRRVKIIGELLAARHGPGRCAGLLEFSMS